MKYKLLILLALCMPMVVLDSCSKDKDVDDTTNTTDESGATSDCVLGYDMQTNYDIIPANNMKTLINEMTKFAQDIDRAKAYREQGLSVSKKDMNSEFGEQWLASGSFDMEVGCYCYRIKSKTQLVRYSVNATTTKPSNSNFVYTHDVDWFGSCDGSKHAYMQANIRGENVYFYKSDPETRSVQYTINPLKGTPKGYYIWVRDSSGNRQAYFEWREYTNYWYWYCERHAF